MFSYILGYSKHIICSWFIFFWLGQRIGGSKTLINWKILLPHLCVVCFITFLAIYQGKQIGLLSPSIETGIIESDGAAIFKRDKLAPTKQRCWKTKSSIQRNSTEMHLKELITHLLQRCLHRSWRGQWTEKSKAFLDSLLKKLWVCWRAIQNCTTPCNTMQYTEIQGAPLNWCPLRVLEFSKGRGLNKNGKVWSLVKDVSLRRISFDMLFVTELFKTSQKLRMLSLVTVYSKVTK